MKEPVLQKLTRRKTGQFITQLTDTGISPVTNNGIISNLASYQKYLVKRGLHKENVWAGQQLPTKGAKQPPEPWTTKEILLMIDVAPTRLLLNAVIWASLSGLRAHELASLRVCDCVTGFYIRPEITKTPHSVRTVPRHA